MADGSYLKGFGVTFKKLFEDRVTGDYRGGKGLEKGKPDEKRPKADRLHGRHVLNRYEDGMEKCIGCELCAGVCPAKCIYVRGADNNPDVWWLQLPSNGRRKAPPPLLVHRSNTSAAKSPPPRGPPPRGTPQAKPAYQNPRHHR